MTDNQVTVAMEKFGSQIPASKVEALCGSMRNADDGCMDGLMRLPLKGKWAAFLFSFFLGGLGAGRFYLGETVVAVLRIVATALTIGLSFVPILGIIASIASAAWLIAEWFLCFNRAKMINYETLNRYLLLNVKKTNEENKNVEE